jgi:RNA polymerase sigma-70 factor (ECF subfamily)
VAVEIRDLIERAAAGEKKAWDSLVNQYSPLVWGVLGKFRNLSQSEKQDLSQDVFVILLERGLQSFRGSTEHEFRWYLKTITENEAKSYLRRRGRHLEVLDSFSPVGGEAEETPLQGSSPADPSPGPEEMAAEQEVLQKLRSCLQQIPSHDQEIFWMRERGISYEEITRVLGLPLGTVASKYHRAKAKIEECLKKAGIL